MPKREKNPSDLKLVAKDKVFDVTVLLLDGGFASTAIGPIEIFHSAGVVWNWLHGETQSPRFRVRAATIDRKPVQGHASIRMQSDYTIRDISRTDIIVVSASGWELMDLITRNSALIPWLRKHHERGAYIVGVCTGVLFLAEAGLLDGREATTHWGVASTLRERYPKVHWRTEQFITEDNGLFCSGGVYAAIDISLYLVQKFCGHEVALQVAKSLLLSMPRSRQSGYSGGLLSPPHTDDRIRHAEEYLREHFRSEVSVELLAQRAGMSPRNFIRRFKGATGRLPGAYMQALRISSAKELLDHGATSIQAVASAIGYEDVAFFRALFKRHTGMTPAEYRERFAPRSFDRGDLEGGLVA